MPLHFPGAQRAQFKIHVWAQAGLRPGIPEPPHTGPRGAARTLDAEANQGSACAPSVEESTRASLAGFAPDGFMAVADMGTRIHNPLTNE